VRQFRYLEAVAAIAVFLLSAPHAVAQSVERENDVLNLINKIREGGMLGVPTFTQASGDEKAMPANIKVVRKALRKCIDDEPFIADLLGSEDGFSETAIVMDCKGSEESYGAIFKFTVADKLSEVTFRPGGILFGPPSFDDKEE
jgi:hypothetical protein